MNSFLRMLKDNSGAAAAEYALILAVVGAGIAIAAIALGGAVSDSIDCAAATIQDVNSNTAYTNCTAGTADAG